MKSQNKALAVFVFQPRLKKTVRYSEKGGDSEFRMLAQ